MNRKRKKEIQRIIRKRKREIERALDPENWPEHYGPVIKGGNTRYEMSDRVRAIDCGGIGAIHCLAQNLGLVDAINRNLVVFKRHHPYWESDHVLNIAYNVACGGTCLDDIELRRNDTTYLDALGTPRIPDPTTAGDFTRRFDEQHVRALMDAVNEIRPQVWKMGLSKQQREEAIIEMDGVIAPTTGECKEGMDMSYKGIWGYHPLIVSLANTNEWLFLVNRPGNRPSHCGAVEWIDRAIDLALEAFRSVFLRGDTDFSLTENFDRWTQRGVKFVFGYDAISKLTGIADKLEDSAWEPLKRREKYSRKTLPRERPKNVKDEVVYERAYKNIRLEAEHVAEFEYQPTKCKRTYRMIVLRKNLSVEKGELCLYDDIRYFFYITNRDDMTPAEVVFSSNDRCNQENLIDQLKNGLNSLRMPVGTLVSNWAFMVMAALPWTLKAWFALMAPKRKQRSALLRMEFRRFVNYFVRIPCQIITTGRQIVYRILGFNEWVPTLLAIFERIRKLRI